MHNSLCNLTFSALFLTQATTVNLEQIDQLLADWKKKIDLVSQNLIDFNSFPTYQRLSGAYGFPNVQLTGITQAQVTPAVEAMNDLFQHFDLLRNTVDQANQLRKQISWFLGSEQKVNQIEQLLTGPSIQLPCVHTPLAQRGLLSAAQTANAIAPETLLMVMTNAFQVAKDVVLAVDQAWERLEPALVNAEVEIVSLQKLADSLAVGSLSELATVRQRIVALREQIDSDPLGVQADFDKEIEPQLVQVRAKLKQLVQQQTQIRDNLAIADQQLKTLLELHAIATAAFRESQEKVTDHSTLQTPLASEQIDALSQWLTRLETKFSEGLLNPVLVGLENWTIKVKQYIEAQKTACTANKAPLAARAELRGRLDALKAKALAWGLAEDTVLVKLAETAKQLLYTRPTPLDQATELVSQYEKRLNSQPRYGAKSP